MWKTGWRLLFILLLVAIFVSFRGREAAAKQGAELVQRQEYENGTYDEVCPVFSFAL